MLEEAPQGTGDERWDAFLVALAEHLAALDGRGAPAWVDFRPLKRFWFPFNTAVARVDAIDYVAPNGDRTASRRRRAGVVYLPPAKNRTVA